MPTKTVLPVVVCLMISGPVAATKGAQPCIVKAAEALPKEPGLIVKKVSMRPMPPEQLKNWQGQTKPVIVDLETIAPGAVQTYSYICSAAGAGQVFVQRVMKP